MTNISTIILVRELDKRLSDWMRDPEPQYDLFFNDLTPMHCEALERALHGALSIHAKKSVQRVAETMEDEA
jgi:hypothetical protein